MISEAVKALFGKRDRFLTDLEKARKSERDELARWEADPSDQGWARVLASRDRIEQLDLLSKRAATDAVAAERAEQTRKLEGIVQNLRARDVFAELEPEFDELNKLFVRISELFERFQSKCEAREGVRAYALALAEELGEAVPQLAETNIVNIRAVWWHALGDALRANGRDPYMLSKWLDFKNRDVGPQTSAVQRAD